jgi:hypothetical protein
MKGLFLFVLPSLLLFSSCMTQRVPPPVEHPGIGRQSSFLVKKIEYDAHGRPLFNDRIGSRPAAVGDAFTVIQTINGFPSRSFDIAIVEKQRTGPGPLAVIYTWTGKGFEGGVQMAEGISPGGATISSGAEAAAYVAMKTAPVVIATAAGFVVGVLASIPETAMELKHVIAGSRETVTGITEYSYDDRGRLRYMKLYPPMEHAEALVRTQFFYEGTGSEPVRTEVTNLVDHSVRHLP